MNEIDIVLGDGPTDTKECPITYDVVPSGYWIGLMHNGHTQWYDVRALARHLSEKVLSNRTPKDPSRNFEIPSKVVESVFRRYKLLSRMRRKAINEFIKKKTFEEKGLCNLLDVCTQVEKIELYFEIISRGLVESLQHFQDLPPLVHHLGCYEGTKLDLESIVHYFYETKTVSLKAVTKWIAEWDAIKCFHAFSAKILANGWRSFCLSTAIEFEATKIFDILYSDTVPVRNDWLISAGFHRGDRIHQVLIDRVSNFHNFAAPEIRKAIASCQTITKIDRMRLKFPEEFKTYSHCIIRSSMITGNKECLLYVMDVVPLEKCTDYINFWCKLSKPTREHLVSFIPKLLSKGLPVDQVGILIHECCLEYRIRMLEDIFAHYAETLPKKEFKSFLRQTVQFMMLAEQEGLILDIAKPYLQRYKSVHSKLVKAFMDREYVEQVHALLKIHKNAKKLGRALTRRHYSRAMIRMCHHHIVKGK